MDYRRSHYDTIWWFFYTSLSKSFYEFEILTGENKGRIIPTWELNIGDIISPLISTGNGILRYALDDCFKVVDFKGKIPCLSFLNHRFSTNLTGENITENFTIKLLSYLSVNDGIALSLLAIDTYEISAPFYCVLFEGKLNKNTNVKNIDNFLKQNLRYKLSRDIHLIGAPKILQTSDGWETYKKLVSYKNPIDSEINIEPLKKISINDWNKYFS